MAKATNNAAIGFLTVVEHEQHGLFGGYLLLNLLGRPLEFHCTTPVKPNRAQQILYGPTLRPFLYGEMIGQTLLAKASQPAQVVCTDLSDVLALRKTATLPVALVVSTNEASDSEPKGQAKTYRLDAAHADRGLSEVFHIGRNSLVVELAHQSDARLIQDRLGGLDENFDLLEPFARIREAIQEAQGSRKE